jgi:hypothetical protein
VDSYEELYNRIPDYIEETEGFGKEQYFSNLSLIERNKNALTYAEQELNSWKEQNKESEGTKQYADVLKEKEEQLANLKTELEAASVKAREVNLSIEQEVLTENGKYKKGVGILKVGMKSKDDIKKDPTKYLCKSLY